MQGRARASRVVALRPHLTLEDLAEVAVEMEAQPTSTSEPGHYRERVLQQLRQNFDPSRNTPPSQSLPIEVGEVEEQPSAVPRVSGGQLAELGDALFEAQNMTMMLENRPQMRYNTERIEVNLLEYGCVLDQQQRPMSECAIKAERDRSGHYRSFWMDRVTYLAGCPNLYEEEIGYNYVLKNLFKIESFPRVTCKAVANSSQYEDFMYFLSQITADLENDHLA